MKTISSRFTEDRGENLEALSIGSNDDCALKGRWGFKANGERKNGTVKSSMSMRLENNGEEQEYKSSRWWKDIWKILERENGSNWFLDRLEKKVENGDGTSYWHDPWAEETSLNRRFERLAKLDTHNGDENQRKGKMGRTREMGVAMETRAFEWEKDRFHDLTYI
ncbi:hypothetical protein DH2020_002414 [Rehmannia glutinosa]|uniref:Uncharacterized protein n=1 Tax=Rehmannia glutinosa TaxID=99300 RepID=A0ABR0XTM0_REHGL